MKAYIKRKHEETESDFARDRYEQYMRQVACPDLPTARASNPTILGRDASAASPSPSVADLSAGDALAFVRGLQLERPRSQIARAGPQGD